MAKRPKVPKNAQIILVCDGYDSIRAVNRLLKPHGLRVRCRGIQGDDTSHIWVERIEDKQTDAGAGG